MGVQVVNARLAFFTDAVSHAAFAGVAIGIFIGMDPGTSLILFCVGFGAMVVALARRGVLGSEAATGVAFSTMVALGLALVAHVPEAGKRIRSLLLGDILFMSDADILRLAAVLAAIVAFHAITGNRLALVSLDATIARAHGVRVAWYEYAHAALLALVVAEAARVAGVLLATAMLIIPAAAARNVARSWGGMCRWSVGIAMAAGGIGIVLSGTEWASETPPGAMMVLTAAAMFVVSLIARRLGVARG